MGAFADSLFSVLLGWLQGAARSLWQLFTGEGGAGLQWVLENWVVLLVLLCIIGIGIDLVVYILRWQPWRVWMRLLHRLRREGAAEEEAPAVPVRQWVYADGSTRVEEAPPGMEPPLQPEPVSPVRRARRAPSLADPSQAYNQPYYPPQWQGDTTDDSSPGIH